MNISYSMYFEEVDTVISEAERLLGAANPPECALLSSRIAEARVQIRSEAPLRLVLIGEFNAGKSSLISALTGANVEIDADVCTDFTKEYFWHGLTLVDTPGVHAEGKDTDHDVISRQATVRADLILFVVTNELFNPRLAAHLRFILDDAGLGLAKKTALIVNKFDRESNREEVLLGEIQKVLGPHQDVAVYFCAASKLLQSKDAPPGLRERFINQSRITELTNGINHFVDDAGSLGRLSTPLQIVADALESLQSAVVVSDNDKKRLELIRRQKTVLQGLQQRLLDIRKTWKQQAYSTVLGQSESAVEQIAEFTTDSDLKGLFEDGMKQAVGEVERLHNGVTDDIDEALHDAQCKLDEIGDSPLARDVERIATEKADSVGVNFNGSTPGGRPIAAILGKAAAKPIKEALESTAKNAKGLRDLVYGVGKGLGKKFRPGEAVKSGKVLADWAGKTAKAVPFFAAALDFYLQYREEKAKEEKAKYLANMRSALRNAFADQAKVEAEALEAGIVKISQGPVAAALANLDAGAAEVTSTGSRKVTLAADIATLRGRCTRLRTRIMSGVQPETEEH